MVHFLHYMLQNSLLVPLHLFVYCSFKPKTSIIHNIEEGRWRWKEIVNNISLSSCVYHHRWCSKTNVSKLRTKVRSHSTLTFKTLRLNFFILRRKNLRSYLKHIPSVTVDICVTNECKKSNVTHLLTVGSLLFVIQCQWVAFCLSFSGFIYIVIFMR